MLQSDSGGLESSVSSEVDSDEEEEEIDKEKQVADFKAVLNWRHIELARIKENSSQGERDEQRDSDEDDNNGLSTLSAASLRRYRKFFMIPTKASASKHAMLEGVENHFARVPVQANDAIAHFIFTAKNKMNNVE
ncbi:unnamed protein product [Heligmosomoides polygyrus]|uniref:SAP30_Sin3_bdg domain-containing protein n=1 Tax=Heligmosomoides polygyrus TaxID=6339 RepID=A0A183GU95_HELPZ|nr:unnamed protein product [Heligmosomoides polygyrus]